MIKLLKNVSVIAFALLSLTISSCSKDEPGSGGSNINGGNSGNVDYAFFIEGGRQNGKYVNSILFSDKDIRNADKWGMSTVFTTYTLDLVSDENYDATTIPTGEFSVGNECRFYFGINQSYESEGEIQGGMLQGSMVKISKNGNKYSFDISGTAGIYYEDEDYSNLKEESMSFHYEGEVIDAGFSEDDF